MLSVHEIDLDADEQEFPPSDTFQAITEESWEILNLPSENGTEAIDLWYLLNRSPGTIEGQDFIILNLDRVKGFQHIGISEAEPGYEFQVREQIRYLLKRIGKICPGVIIVTSESPVLQGLIPGGYPVSYPARTIEVLANYLSACPII